VADLADPADPALAIDVDALRASTPGCEHVVHLNNAGASLAPEPVLDAVVGHLRLEAAIGGYEAAASASAATARSYGAVAELVGGRPDQIAFADSASRAWFSFFSGVALDLGPGDRILTGLAEYASNALPLLLAADRTGCEVVVVPDDEHGQVDVRALADLLDQRTKLVSLTHVPTNGGLVNPAEAVGAAIADSASDAIYLLDACQSAGQVDLDVAAIGCDALTATGRKYLRGPRGTGFLYVSDRALDRVRPAAIDLHSGIWTGDRAWEWADGATRFEMWECSVAGRIGLGVAVDHALEVGVPAIEARVAGLAARLRARLAERPGVTVHDKGERRCGIVTFAVEGHEAAAVSARLRSEHGINTSVTSTSHTRWDSDDRHLAPMVRASVHAYNTVAEVDLLVEAVASPAP
jgi:selenocysteine lyase/cysteine desulfurase